jgi:hypothetical protein
LKSININSYRKNKNNMQSNKKKENTNARAKFSIKNNHLIQCYIYQNATLFKGDTYVYRGLFNRFGGYYDKSHFGFIVPLENYEKVREEIMRMAFGFIVYKKESEVIKTDNLFNTHAAATIVDNEPPEPVNSLKFREIS